MLKTTSITTRISPEIKAKAEDITEKLGMNISEAISIFLAQLVAYRGLPFEVRIPQLDSTKFAMLEAENIISGAKKAKLYNSEKELSQMWQDMDKEDNDYEI
jgi:DNA-damage-inducible protein J